MLLFSTVLPIKDTMTKDDFIRLVIEWNQTSPYPENIIPNIEWNGERNVSYGTDELDLAIEEYRNKNIIAIRYEKTETDGVVWDTDYVMNFDEMQLAVRLDRSYLESALNVNLKFSTPHFISMLIEHDYIEDDGNLPISNRPIIIEDSDVEMLAKIINGESQYRLPVVYVSKTFYGKDPVDIKRMSGRLKGIAHVLVQKGGWQNSEIRQLCDNKNEYHGAIGIYYPNKAVGHRRFFYRAYDGSDDMLMEKVIRSVINYNISQMVDKLYTWSGVNNALLQDRYSSQKEEKLVAEYEKAKAVNEADQLIESVDEELTRLQRQVDRLTKTIDSLTYENQGLRAKLDSSEDIPILYLGDEDEFFQGEIREMILDALIEKMKGTPNKTRRYDVLNDIILKNGYEGVFDKKAAEVKATLRDYKSMSGTTKQVLIDMGFIITEEGKHYRLTYYGDGRYKTTVAKSGSDHREGKNIAATIIKNML